MKSNETKQPDPYREQAQLLVEGENPQKDFLAELIEDSYMTTTERIVLFVLLDVADTRMNGETVRDVMLKLLWPEIEEMASTCGWIFDPTEDPEATWTMTSMFHFWHLQRAKRQGQN